VLVHILGGPKQLRYYSSKYRGGSIHLALGANHFAIHLRIMAMKCQNILKGLRHRLFVYLVYVYVRMWYCYHDPDMLMYLWCDVVYLVQHKYYAGITE